MEDYRQMTMRLSRVFMRKIIFVTGISRPATDWVSRVLGSHPLALPAIEGHFTDLLGVGIGQTLNIYNKRIDGIRSQLERTGQVASPIAYGDDEMLYLLRQLIALQFAKMPMSEETKCLIDKTPEHAVAIDALARALPEACFVNLVRDGRDEAVSAWLLNTQSGNENFLSKYPDFPSFADSFADNWVHLVGAARHAGKKLGPERYLEIRWEDITESPIDWTAKILDFAGLDHDDALTAHCSGVACDATPDHAAVGIRDQSFNKVMNAGFCRKAGELMKLVGYEQAS